MENKPKKWQEFLNFWLPNLYYVGALISFFLILGQVFYAKRTVVQSNEWEKAKVTLENIERFRENLTNTVLYNHPEALKFSDNLWPDFTKQENRMLVDTLRKVYFSCFDEYNNDNDYKTAKFNEDFLKTLNIMDAFAYPIIMGYANEMGSAQSINMYFYTYGNFIILYAFDWNALAGPHAKLLYRLWRVRVELQFFQNYKNQKETLIKIFNDNINNLLCFEGTEITAASLKKYEKKLTQELKKIQKEIEEFRKNSLK